MPPNSQLSRFYGRKLGLFSLLEMLCGPQIYPKCVGGRDSAPDLAGELTTGLTIGTPLPIPTSSALLAPRFSCLRRSAAVAPNVKSWLRPV